MAPDQSIPLRDLGQPDVDSSQSTQLARQPEHHLDECDPTSCTCQPAASSLREPTALAAGSDIAFPHLSTKCSPPPTQVAVRAINAEVEMAAAGDCGLRSQHPFSDVDKTSHSPVELPNSCPMVQPHSNAGVPMVAHGDDAGSSGPLSQNSTIAAPGRIDSDELFRRFRMTDELSTTLWAWVLALRPFHIVYSADDLRRERHALEHEALQRGRPLDWERIEIMVAGDHRIHPITLSGDKLISHFHHHVSRVDYHATFIEQSGEKLSILVRNCGVGMPEKPWSEWELRVLYSLIWITSAANAFQHSIIWNGVVTPSVALFDGDQTRSAAYIVADLVTVASCLAMAVASEFLRRAHCLVAALGFAATGLVLFATTRSMATLSAGQVFYGIGFTGIRLILDILVSDSTGFRNRSLAYAATATPWALTAFSVPALRKDSPGSEMRPAIAAFAGIIPLLGGMLAGFLQRFERRTPKPKPIRDVIRRLRGPKFTFYGPRQDVFERGRLLCLGMSLTTFSLLSSLLSLFVLLWLVHMDVTPWFAILPPAVLLCSITAFLIALKNSDFNRKVCRSIRRLGDGFKELLPMDWVVVRHFLETWLENIGGRITGKMSYARKQFYPGESLVRPMHERTTLGTCALCLLWKLAHASWSTNLHPYLQVSYGLSKSNARHLTSAVTVTEVVTMVAVGVVTRQAGYVTPVIWAAVPCYIVGGLLMILAPLVDDSLSLLVLSQLLMTVSRSSFEALKEVLVLYFAAADESPIILAFLSLGEKLGGTIGATLSDKLWATVLPDGPKKYLSAEAVLGAERTHPLLQQHLSYAIGTMERSAIQRSYDVVQRNSLIVCCSIMVVGAGCAMALRNINVLDSRPPPVLGEFPFRWMPNALPPQPETRVRPDVLKLSKQLERMVQTYSSSLDLVEQLWRQVENSKFEYPQHVADILSSEMTRFVGSLSSLGTWVEKLMFLATIPELYEGLPYLEDAQTTRASRLIGQCHIQ